MSSRKDEHLKEGKPVTLEVFNFSDVPLPSNFILTKEEQALLDTYASIRLMEKEAAKLREAQAKAKLTAAHMRYKKQLESEKIEVQPAEEKESIDMGKQSKSTKKRKDRPKGSAVSTASTSSRQSAEDSAEDADEESFLTLSESKPEEYQNSSLETKAVTEEAMRGELLGEVARTDTVPLIKKKPKKEGPDLSTMLLSAVEPLSTPPHDFSKNLALVNDGVAGSILFPPTPSSVAGSFKSIITSWSPPEDALYPTDRCLEISLPNFDRNNLSGKAYNTIAIKFTAPAESKRFSFNITGPNHEDYSEILVHFNPRQHEKGGQLVVNDKQESTWGNALKVPLSEIPKIFGQTAITMIVQINADAFDFFVEGKHCVRFLHRTVLPSAACSLNLHFPSTDDNGNPESWKVHRVWWGQKETMVVEGSSTVAGADTYDSVHPKKIFIQGLAKITSELEGDERRAELERAFHKYGGNEGAIVTAPLNCTFAFVELESERQVELALLEQKSLYRMSKARRTRFEALQEQRASSKAKERTEEQWE